jgi:hypothetical protein
MFSRSSSLLGATCGVARGSSWIAPLPFFPYERITAGNCDATMVVHDALLQTLLSPKVVEVNPFVLSENAAETL